MNETTIISIAKTLDLLAKKINEESGNKIMIMFSMENGNDLYTGGVKHGNVEFMDACKMAVSMTHYISAEYGDGNDGE